MASQQLSVEVKCWHRSFITRWFGIVIYKITCGNFTDLRMVIAY